MSERKGGPGAPESANWRLQYRPGPRAMRARNETKAMHWFIATFLIGFTPLIGLIEGVGARGMMPQNLCDSFLYTNVDTQQLCMSTISGQKTATRSGYIALEFIGLNNIF